METARCNCKEATRKTAWEENLFHHDNATAHTSKLRRDVLRVFRSEILHPPFSPDLAPSDFFLFPKMKEGINGVRQESKEEAKEAALDWIACGSAFGFLQRGLGAMGTSYGHVSAGRWRLCRKITVIVWVNFMP